MKYLARIDRMGRSLLTLSRDREYKTLKQMPVLKPIDRVLDIGSGDGFWTSRFAANCAQVIGLEPAGEIIGHQEAACVRFQLFLCGVVIPVHRGVLNDSVHALNLSVCPGML